MSQEKQNHSKEGQPLEIPELVGVHPAMQEVLRLVRKVGPSRAPVLVTGESGTGKELVARALHQASLRGEGNFVPVHCGAIPEDLLESELFGHVKGAFTGALAARAGRFQSAHRGTIFLDEIGEMSPRFQVKLLRVLEDGSFDPVGATQSMHTDCRVIAATHRDLRSLAKQGQFREDLLYRLDVVEIHLPPLRERREDIALIAQHHLAHLHEAKGLARFTLTDEACKALEAHDWPGNVRELCNVLERAAVLAEEPGQITPADLPEALGNPVTTRANPEPSRDAVGAPWNFGPEGTDFYKEMEGFERRMIARALQLAGGSKREAARLLQVNRTTLLEKLKRRGWTLRGGALEPRDNDPHTLEEWQPGLAGSNSAASTGAHPAQASFAAAGS